MAPSRFLTAAIAAIAVAGLTACSADESSPEPESVLTLLSVEPSQGLDPALVFADASRIPMAYIYETLIERDEDGEFVGSLASDWTISDDGLTYTFTLRDDSSFSDGSPIKASDVVFSLERAQAAEPLSGQLEGVKIEALDDKTIELSLEKPSVALLTTLATPGSAGILSEAAVSDGGESYFTKPTATSGPWTIEEYVPKSHATFVANPEYYNVPNVTRIEYVFSEDFTTHAAAVESGTADIAGVGYADAQMLRKDETSGIQVVEVDQLTPLFWGWDRTKPPFDDVRARQAVAWAVDREGRLDACWFGTGAATYGNILRPWDPAYQELNTYQADSREAALDNARELLDDAGWVEDGGPARVARGVTGVEDGTPLAVTVPYEGNWNAAECHVQILQQNLAEVGIAVTPASHDPAAYWGDVANNAFTMYHGGAAAFDAADLYMNWFHSEGGLNELTTHLNDPWVDAEVEKADGAKNIDDAIAIYQALEEWQAEELPMLVVGYQWQQNALGPRVGGWTNYVDADSRWLVALTVND